MYGGKFAFTLNFLLCFTLYPRANSKYKPLEGGGGEVFCVTILGAYIWRGLFSEFYGASANL